MTLISVLPRVLANEFTFFSLKQEFLFSFLKSPLCPFPNPSAHKLPKSYTERKSHTRAVPCVTATSLAAAPLTTSAGPLDALKEKSLPGGSNLRYYVPHVHCWGSKFTSLSFDFLGMFNKMHVLSFPKSEVSCTLEIKVSWG